MDLASVVHAQGGCSSSCFACYRKSFTRPSALGIVFIDQYNYSGSGGLYASSGSNLPDRPAVETTGASAFRSFAARARRTAGVSRSRRGRRKSGCMASGNVWQTMFRSAPPWLRCAALGLLGAACLCLGGSSFSVDHAAKMEGDLSGMRMPTWSGGALISVGSNSTASPQILSFDGLGRQSPALHPRDSGGGDN